MPQRIARPGRRAFSFLFVVGLAAGLALLIWFSGQADDASVAMSFGESSARGANAAPRAIQSSEAATGTVFLPLVVGNLSVPLPLFGVQMGPISNRGGLQQALQAGVYWVRFDTFAWDRIEPTRTSPPTYDWSSVDTGSLSNASKNGMEVIGLIQFAPDWAQMYPGAACGPIRQDSLAAFAEFLKELVARYSVPPYNVRYWELGNEPDIDHTLIGGRAVFGCWGDLNDPYYGGGYYAEMLKVAYPAIKAADPKAQVRNGGVLLDCDPRDPYACSGSAHGDKRARFLEGILANGGGPYFDILSFHAYSHYEGTQGQMTNRGWPGSVTAVPEKVGFLQEVLNKYGVGDKPLMNTEAALLCETATAECLETQAVYVPRAYADALMLELLGQQYFTMINEHWYYTGLLLPDFTPKPVYNAFKTASSFLKKAAYQGAVTSYPPGVEGYSFVRLDSPGHLDLIWSEDGSSRDLVLPARAKAYDRYGNLISSTGAIQLDHGPVYVTRP
jgi:hypothetical protein